MDLSRFFSRLLTGRGRLLLLAISLGPAGCQTQPGGLIPGGLSGILPNNGGSPLAPSASVLEQLSLERINRARLQPAAEAQFFAITVDEGIPGQITTAIKQPLAPNARLRESAIGHSQDMLDQNYFEHNSPDGRTPADRMAAAGYVFRLAGENLAWRGTTGPVDEVQTIEDQHRDLFVDAGIARRGHRVTMLNANFREVGIGIARGPYLEQGTRFDSMMQTQDYGEGTTNSTLILGVVYDDLDRDGQYDAGEGISGATVTLGSVGKTTGEGGGYSFEVLRPGTYTLRFGPAASANLEVTAGSPNQKVDFVDGSQVVVNLGLGILR